MMLVFLYIKKLDNAVLGIDIQSVFSHFLILLLKKDLDLTLRNHLLF